MMVGMVGSLAAAVVVLSLLVLLPGPDVAVVTRVALSSGRRAAAEAAAGIVAGLIVWGGLTVAGLAAILATSAQAYAVVKYAGAAYLVLIGLHTLWQTRRRPAEDSPATADPAAVRHPWRAGLMTNVLNPKIAVFYTGLLPQLVPAGAPTTPTLIGLVAIHVLLTLAWLNLYAGLLHAARTTVQRPKVRTALERVTGIALVGLGARVATQSR
jgi:threonine/homoserine/homoserine lactone efflux protein